MGGRRQEDKPKERGYGRCSYQRNPWWLFLRSITKQTYQISGGNKTFGKKKINKSRSENEH